MTDRQTWPWWKKRNNPTPAREPLVRYLQVQVKVQVVRLGQSHVRASRLIPPSDQWDRRRNDHKIPRAGAQLGKSSIITWGEKSSSSLLSLSLSYHTYHKHAERKGTNEKKRLCWCLSLIPTHYTLHSNLKEVPVGRQNNAIANVSAPVRSEANKIK